MSKLSCYGISAALILFSFDSFADARTDRFRKRSKPNQFVSFGGTYKSDHNSKQRDFILSYQFKNDRFLNEIDLRNRINYVSTATKETRKDEELYDGEFSSKIVIGKSNNYFNLYNRSKYDEFSSYYYDITTVGGLGRMFFNRAVYLDFNMGWNQIKNSDSQMVINPTLRVSFDLTKKLRLTQIGYFFRGETIQDEYLKTRLSYRLNRNIRLEIYYNYEKERFVYKTKSITENRTEVGRSYVLRLRYDF